MAVITIFGDSVTFGEYDQERLGWATMLRQEVERQTAEMGRPYHIVYNLGIPGDTTAGLLKRFSGEMEARRRDGQPYLCILAFGANDSTVTPSNGQFRVSLSDYEANLKNCIGQVKSYTDQFFFLNTTPVIDERTRTIAGKDRSHLNQYIDEYNRTLAEVCTEKQVVLIDVHAEFPQTELERLMVADGLHPNVQGHQRIFALVMAELRRRAVLS